MNRTVKAHLRSIMPDHPLPDDPIFLGGGSRPNYRLRELCRLAGIRRKLEVEIGEEHDWLLKDLRKTCATYYDVHLPESSVEVFGHSMSRVTYKHYAHRDSLAFKAIMTIPQPSAFTGLERGFEEQCPCGRRRF